MKRWCRTSSIGRTMLVFVFLWAMLWAPGAGAQTVQYVYDALDRLIAVVDTNGDTAVYHYDAVGNLLSIDRVTSSQVSIISFSPGSGPVGTTVTIYGTGFSATPSESTVTFNGTGATVSSATTTKLVVTVPTGASTGTIAVTSPNGSANSATNFTVGPGNAPIITSFTPSIGTGGTSISVTGANFDTVAANDRTRLNATLSAVSSVTSTSLSTAVPPFTGSGPITIGTPLGVAVSATDFFVPPSPYVAADVVFTDRMTVGGSKTVTVGTANKIGLVTFAATAGQRVSVKASSVTMSSGWMTLFKANNTSAGAAIMFSGSTAFIDAQALPVTGSYTVMVDPISTYTGNATLNVYDVIDVTGTIPADGTPTAVTTNTPGQNARLTFSGTSGQRISLKTSSTTIADAAVKVLKPDGTTLGSVGAYTGYTTFLDVQTLPVAGTYAVLVDPSSMNMGSTTLTLYDVPADITGSITPGGSAVAVATTTPGQNGRLTFSGTSGQRVSLKTTSTTFADVTISVLKPDGSTLASMTTWSGYTGFIDAQTLPTTGTYTVFVNPTNHYTGSTTVTLYDVADTTGTVAVNGSSVGVTLSTPGQNGTLTFSGTASQQATVHVTGNTMGSVTVTLLKPDGSQLTSSTSSSGSFDLATQTLPTTVTYTIGVDPSSLNTGTMNVSVTSP
jgi:YD repeat-containing protein